MYNENTTLFVRHANEIYARFNDWKSIDRFYFIPLELDMTYSIDGHRISMTDGPLYLGTFVRTVLEHPELFQFKCPACGKVVLPYHFNGSPLSGRVDLEGACDCGWGGFESVSGWHIRAEALRAQIAKDKRRSRMSRLLQTGIRSASIRDLLGIAN